ncbi:MAG TPA: HlyD family secretion protein [Patescibacteria group bacterium]|nr:HlyD family secretion protein [Patescibacteria group bacterium]
MILTATALCIGFVYGTNYALESFTHESTDDAFLESHIITVAPRVSGQVLDVHVKENQRVKAGDPLLEIDPRDYQIQVAQKQAARASADANLGSAQAGIELVKARYETALAAELQERANAEADRAKSERADADFKRAQKLRDSNVMSPEEFDRARAEAESARADWHAAEQKAAAAKSQIGESRAQINVAKTVLEGMSTKTKLAETEQSAAELALSYTKITSPSDGQVVRKTVEPGNYVQTGQSLMALVTTQLWVVANFKENQLRHMRVGAPAEIRLDASPGRSFRGHVDSFQAGSGSRFSLLPPENAVGNYVKIVQRVPVKLYFDEPLETSTALGPGMSAVPLVLTRELTVSRAIIWAAAVVLSILTTLGLMRVLKHLRE